jgi:uncharacterized protein YjiS (DUF1127 family)
MTYLRSVPSEFDNVFKLQRFGALLPPSRLVAGRVPGQFAVLGAALGVAVAVLGSWRRAVEAGRTQHHFMQLDDHLLRDIGLSRTDVCFCDLETLGRHRCTGGIR